MNSKPTTIRIMRIYISISNSAAKYKPVPPIIQGNKSINVNMMTLIGGLFKATPSSEILLNLLFVYYKSIVA